MRSRALTLLAAAYVAAAAYGFSDPRLRAGADAIADGRVWTLLTSGLQPQGPAAAAQIAVLGAVVAAVIVREGPVTWWAAALAGHVGSALVAYAAIAGAVWLGSAAAQRAGDQPDFGVSCVLGGSFGALLASGIVRGNVLVTAVGGAALLVSLPLSVGWYEVEHVLAVLLGAAVAWPLVRAREARWT
jgi:hypothetical protein